MAKRKKHTGKIILIVVLVILIFAVLAFGLGLKYYLDNLKSPNPTNKEVAFTIEEGQSMNEVIDSLYRKGFIKDDKVAKLYVKLNRINDYYAGNFILNTDYSLEDIMAVITDVNKATREEVLVTLIDGGWAKDYAKAIAKQTNLTSIEIMEKWNDVAYLNTLIDQYEFLTEDILKSEHCALEGYLFPETYSFYKNTTVEQVTETILAETNRVYEKYAEEIKKADLSIHELFTLSSIVMYEASTQEDMGNVAGVFYNRLADHWMLQSSVTVCYALYEYDSWTDCEENTQISSPYNTYKVEGLPIGPVCNSNEMALQAVIHPTKNDYYFFIADIYGSGKVIFARTYEEHQRNIEKYLY